MEGFFFFFFVWALLVGLAISAFFVLLFMTGRKAPDPRGVLLPAAFSLSITLAGVFGALMSLATMSTAVGIEAAGLSSSCGVSVTTDFESSASHGTPLAQQEPPPPGEQTRDQEHSGEVITINPFPQNQPPPAYQPPPPYEQPEIEIQPLPPIDTPNFDEPPSFVPRRPGDFPSEAPAVRCDSAAGRRLLSAFPWLIVSAAAVGGGSRLFRTQLNEERSL